MKHFEDVWNEAEAVSLAHDKTPSVIKDILIDDIKCFFDRLETDSVDESEIIGSILFNLAYLCRKHDINSWTALEKITNEHKIDLYSQDEQD